MIPPTGDWGSLALTLALCVLLATATLTDLDRRIIPNAVVLTAAVAAVALAAVSDPASLGVRATAAVAAGGLLLLIALVYPPGIGMGDVKLAAVMGLYLGRAVAPALLIGFAAGALLGLALIARRGAAARKQSVPLAPFLAVGGIVAMGYGDGLMDWYLGTFFAG